MPYQIYKVKDKTEGYKLKKRDIFDLPAKIGIFGRSELAGKTTTVLNLMLLPEYYGNDFKPENVFVVSPSAYKDNKWKTLIRMKDIPDENVFTEFDEEKLNVLYEFIQEQYQDALQDERTPEHTIIVFDDFGFTNDLKRSNLIDRLACNGRHMLCSTLVCCQKYTQASTCFRENMTGGIFFACSNKQLDLIYEDHGNMPKKEFVNLFRRATKGRHAFFVVNYSNDEDQRFSESVKDHNKGVSEHKGKKQ